MQCRLKNTHPHHSLRRLQAMVKVMNHICIVGNRSIKNDCLPCAHFSFSPYSFLGKRKEARSATARIERKEKASKRTTHHFFSTS